MTGHGVLGILLIILLFFNIALFFVLIIVVIKQLKFNSRHTKRKLELYQEFVDKLEEHSGDMIIEAEIKNLYRKIKQ